MKRFAEDLCLLALKQLNILLHLLTACMLDLCLSDPNYFGPWVMGQRVYGGCQKFLIRLILKPLLLFYSHLFLCGHWLRVMIFESEILLWILHPWWGPSHCQFGLWTLDYQTHGSHMYIHGGAHHIVVWCVHAPFKHLQLYSDKEHWFGWQLYEYGSHTHKKRKEKKEAYQTVSNPVGCWYPANRQLKKRISKTWKASHIQGTEVTIVEWLGFPATDFWAMAIKSTILSLHSCNIDYSIGRNVALIFWPRFPNYWDYFSQFVYFKILYHVHFFINRILLDGMHSYLSWILLTIFQII